MKTVLFICTVFSVTMVWGQRIESNVYTWKDANIEKTKSGEKRTLVKGEATDFKEWTIYATTLKKKKTDADQHASDYERMIFVKDGEVNITLNGENKTVGKGSVALILPGDNVTLANASKTDPVTYYVIKYKSKNPEDRTRGKENNLGGSFVMDWNDVKFNSRSNGLGGTRQFFDVKTAMGTRMDLHATLLEPKSSSHAPHNHRAEELILVLDANTDMYMGPEETGGVHKKATDGDIIWLKSMDWHGITNLADTSASYFAFQFQ